VRGALEDRCCSCSAAPPRTPQSTELREYEVCPAPQPHGEQPCKRAAAAHAAPSPADHGCTGAHSTEAQAAGHTNALGACGDQPLHSLLRQLAAISTQRSEQPARQKPAKAAPQGVRRCNLARHAARADHRRRAVNVQHAQQRPLQARDGSETLLMGGGENGPRRTMGAPPSLQDQNVIQVLGGMHYSPHSVAAEHAGCGGAGARHRMQAAGEGATEEEGAQQLLGATARHTGSICEAIQAAQDAVR
jgi:hypothetical protein